MCLAATCGWWPLWGRCQYRTFPLLQRFPLDGMVLEKMINLQETHGTDNCTDAIGKTWVVGTLQTSDLVSSVNT